MHCSSICIVQIHWHIQNTQSLHKKSPTHVPVSPTAIYFFPCCLSLVLSAVESKFDLLFCIVPIYKYVHRFFWERNLQSQIRITFSMKLVFWFAIEWNFTRTLIFVDLIQFVDLKASGFLSSYFCSVLSNTDSKFTFFENSMLTIFLLTLVYRSILAIHCLLLVCIF